MPRVHCRCLVLFYLAFSVIGCHSVATDSFKRNAGNSLTTQEGEKLTVDQFYGKWDLNGWRTNAQNKIKGFRRATTTVSKEVFGDGWRFERNNVLLVDKFAGTDPGTWKIQSPDKLIVREPKRPQADTYTAQFIDGFLYLRHDETGEWRVFERDKFLGF